MDTQLKPKHRWEATGGRPGVRALYLSLMDALTAVNPTSLFFIQALRHILCSSRWGTVLSRMQARIPPAKEPILLHITKAGAGCSALTITVKTTLTNA